MSNKDTHELVISAMAPSFCSNCSLSGAELDWNPCPNQKSETGEILQEAS